MQNIIDSIPKLWGKFRNYQPTRNGIIFLNLLLLAFWLVNFYIFSATFFDHPEGKLWLSTIYFPLFVIVGIAFAIIGHYGKRLQILKFGLIIPLAAAFLYVVTIASVLLLFDPVSNFIFRLNPPKTIADLAKEENLTLQPEMTIDNVFFLPEGVSFNDIIEWNGTMLLYATKLPENEVHAFYTQSYRGFGFEGNGAGGFGGINFVFYKMPRRNGFACFYYKPIEDYNPIEDDQVIVALLHHDQECPEK